MPHELCICLLYNCRVLVFGGAMTPLAHQLLTWFTAHARPLPWRQTYNPYHVWLAEIMAQQTQMERVVGYFCRFISAIPSIADLAQTPEENVLKLWEGLGYYRRARHLHQCARLLCQDFGGQLPHNPSILQRLPGIGPYVAAAIASIAYNLPVPLLDANVLRIGTRLLAWPKPTALAATRQRITAFCQEHLPLEAARSFNQGLMELGALVCTPRAPRCPDCPIAGFCQANQHQAVDAFPVRPPRPQIIHITMATGLLWHEGRVLVQQRHTDDVWGGLWEFPGGVVEAHETPQAAVCREFAEETALNVIRPIHLGVFRHSYMHYRVRLHAFQVHLASPPHALELRAAQAARWATWEEVLQLPFPAGHRKLIQWLNHHPQYLPCLPTP